MKPWSKKYLYSSSSRISSIYFPSNSGITTSSVFVKKNHAMPIIITIRAKIIPTRMGSV